ncbi:GNAT family N-acetyltransferase [Candidatus Cardinium sp. TP]|uniref:GNAT family N-acetyltransferase n=1 Tax=Candidatus Cardinium sp. TP TaxID=2961955 RepID=UPI0021AFEFD6|nr:GNAT family protein [Candidatus Cardinium sp. TP]MCT4696911.1 GNAT family N-acetyltransferase [Candidatus Cardinium sp. TP]
MSACSKLIEIGFKALDLEVIAIRCAVENIQSQKIPTRLGLKKPNVVLKKENMHGTHMDIVVYTIQKDQWLNQKVKA